MFNLRIRTYSTAAVLNPLPATFIRGGTSKGIFINQAHLPKDRKLWKHIFLGIMGSPDHQYARQLNGMGGGISSLSKICVVGPVSPENQQSSGVHFDVDVEYTFAQVGIKDAEIDYSGNCGNLSSMIGVFALDEGLCKPTITGRHARVRSFNTNTNKIVDTTFPVRRLSSPESQSQRSVSHGEYIPMLDENEASIAGVPGTASQIILEFLSPGGARTGKLLPSGNPIDTLTITVQDANKNNHNNLTFTIPASLVDATNPTVFITSTDLQRVLPVNNLPSPVPHPHSPSHSPSPPIDFSDPTTLQTLESIRQEAARVMHLDPSAQAQPKLAIISDPPPTTSSNDTAIDISVHALSMGALHKAAPMTVGLCLGVAARIKHSLAWEIVRRSRGRAGDNEKQGATLENGLVRILHPSGTVDVGAEWGGDGAGTVHSAQVVRTGRRLMKGVVWW